MSDPPEPSEPAGGESTDGAPESTGEELVGGAADERPITGSADEQSVAESIEGGSSAVGTPGEDAVEPVEAEAVTDRSSDESGLKRWVLLDGNRMVLTAVILASVFAALVLATVVWPFEMQQLVTESTTVQSLLDTLLSGTILLVSIVVSVNSLVLSQDLATLGNQQERVENAIDFRNSVEDLAGTDAPSADPADIVQTDLEVVLARLEDLREIAAESDDEAFANRVEPFADAVWKNTEHMVKRVAESDPYSVDVVVAGLTYPHSTQLRGARSLREDFGDSLSEEDEECLDELIEAMRLFAVGNNYLKSLFYMREFSNLSKALLYVALPVIVLISYVLLAISSGELPSFQVGLVSGATLFVMAAYTVSLAPYVTLTAFVFRSATVAGRSLAVNPLS